MRRAGQCLAGDHPATCGAMSQSARARGDGKVGKARAGLPQLVWKPPPRYRAARISRTDRRLPAPAKVKAMKAETHPDYHLVKVIMTDGTEFTTRAPGANRATRCISTSIRSRIRPGPAASSTARPRRAAVALSKEVRGLSQEITAAALRGACPAASLQAGAALKRRRARTRPSAAPIAVSTGLPAATLTAAAHAWWHRAGALRACSFVERAISS